MSPDEASENLQFLEGLARQYGMSWVVREADAGLEQTISAPRPDARLRLVAVINALIEVLMETHELERAVPMLLLDGTDSEVLIRYDGDEPLTRATLASAGGASSPVDLQRTVGALTALRELAEDVE